MAAVGSRKVQVLHDHAVLALFTLPDQSHLLQQARDYLALRHDEEMVKLERRVWAEKIVAAREAAEAAREMKEQAAKVELPQHNCIPPQPAATAMVEPSPLTTFPTLSISTSPISMSPTIGEVASKRMSVEAFQLSFDLG